MGINIHMRCPRKEAARHSELKKPCQRDFCSGVSSVSCSSHLQEGRVTQQSSHFLTAIDACATDKDSFVGAGASHLTGGSYDMTSAR